MKWGTKRMIRLWWPAICLMLFSNFVHAQYFSTGQDPFGMKWEEVRTQNFRILYDESFRPEAVRLVRLMESYRLPASQSLGADPKPITIVIHSNSVTSNAMVPVAPRRLEFYPLSPQDGVAQEWFRQLSIHEYRHVAQFSVIDQGFTRGLKYVFGEQALAAVMGAMVPFWYIEGDATVMETALSASGRGRLPDFISPLRTQLLEHGRYSYEKAVFGSYRNYIPDRYILGYHIVGASRQYFGSGIWQNALENTARKPWMIRPFSQSLKKETGSGVVNLYKAMMDSLQQEWADDTLGNPYSPYWSHPIKKKRSYTDYLHPFPMDDGSIICLRKGIDDIPRFVLIDSTGDEEEIFTPGFIIDESIGYGDGVIVWSEYQSDIRWENQSYSDIWILDIKTRKARKLTHNARYFSPSVSKFGRRIAVSYTSTENKQELHVIDGRTGRLLSSYPHPSNHLIISPSWAFNDSLIIFIAAGPAGKGIQSLNPALGTFSMLMPQTPLEIRQPFCEDGGVFFTAGYGGVRNLYVMDFTWKYIWKMTSSRYGVSDAFFDTSSHNIWFSEYTINGYRPVWAPILELSQIPVLDANAFSMELADALSVAEARDSVIESDSFNYELKKYNRLSGLINPHSWAPLSISASSQSASPGISVLSQDILGTTFIEAGWALDLNEQAGKWYFDASIRSFFPVFDLNYSWGMRNSTYRNIQGDTLPFSWKESIMRAGVSLPLNFHRGKWLRWFTPSVRYSYINPASYNQDVDVRSDAWSTLFLFGDRPFHNTPAFIPTGNVNSFDYGLYLVNQRRSGLRDFRPVWRQSFDFRYRHSPWGKRTLGKIYGVNTSFYFPGALKHHSIRMALSGQIRQPGNSFYTYGNLIPVPRGLHGLTQDTLTYASISYAFPIVYPDLSLGPLAFIKRLKADVFIDLAAGMRNNEWTQYRSVGTDLTVDAHFLRFIAPVELGVRSVYLPATREWTYHLILQMNFYDI